MQQTYPPFLSSPLHPFPAMSVFSTPPPSVQQLPSPQHFQWTTLAYDSRFKVYNNNIE